MKYTRERCNHCGGRGFEPDYDETCRIMREARKASGRTLKEVARHMGFSQGYIHDVEWARRKPTAGFADAYLRAIGRGKL